MMAPPYLHHKLTSKKKGGKHASRLSTMKQMSCPELVQLSEFSCMKDLEMLGFLPTASELGHTRRCWRCQSSMTPSSELRGKPHLMILRCSRKGCQKRITSWAYTPMFSGKELTCAIYLRLTYLYGLETHVDQAMHLAGVSYKCADRVFKCFKVATSWHEKKAGDDLPIDHGEVEVDGAKFGVQGRGKPQAIHVGRVLAVAGRDDGQRIMVPLPPRPAPRSRNPGPESFAEVRPALSRIIGHGALQVSDSARAFGKSAKARGAPAVTVNHPRAQYSCFAKVPIAGTHAAFKDMAMKRPSSSSSSQRTRASTNMVEGFIGNTKNLLRKRGLLGGGASQQSTLNTLSGSWSLKYPGVERLGEAMAAFRRARMDQMSPGDLFKCDFL